MLQSFSRRSALVVVLSFAAFAAGVLSATLMLPREAHAQSLSSTLQVPEEGLTFRSVDGRAIARLSYDAHGGVFEVLGDRGEPVASLGQRGRAGLAPAEGPKTEWSLDDAPDPWARAPGRIKAPPSGL
jgi:hypothetical protein